MTGTPLRRLSPTHSTMRSTAGLMSTTSASGNDETPAIRVTSAVPSTTAASTANRGNARGISRSMKVDV